MKLVCLLYHLALTISAFAIGPLVKTSTGPILGSKVAPDVFAWKGIPFAVPPTGAQRWTIPILNNWTDTKNTTALGAACMQQFGIVDGVDFSQLLYNNPPLVENEDCLTINIWAPSSSSKNPRAVLFWIFGGGFQFGGSGTSFYDGTSFSQNQDVVVVSHNYRTNVFGFPNSPEIPLKQQNLGLFDQHLALSWTRANIAKFGGDPNKITLFGQSAGSGSAALLVEHFQEDPPFHGAILQSGVVDALDNSVSTPDGNFTVWNSIAAHFDCPSPNGNAQIDCLKHIPARDIEQFIANNSLGFIPQADGGASVPNQPTRQLETGAVARVPIMIGDNAQGSAFPPTGQENFTSFISQPPLNILPPDQLRDLYPVPGKFDNDFEAIVALMTDVQFRCRSSLFSNIFTNKRLSTVYRYVFGAVLSEFQVFPGAGAPEGAEMPSVFGNLNGTINATEVVLSKTMQAIWANFAKHPDRPPAPNWLAYEPTRKVIAALAFDGNVKTENIVNLQNSSSFDSACQLLNMLNL